MNDFLVGILNSINAIVNNYGWAIVVFTVLIKVALFPLDYKSRKSMRKMQTVQPEVSRLQKKYANDKDKLNQKTMELYRREKINPMMGCVPMLLSMPVLFAMFAAMRLIANTELAKQAIDLITTGVQTNEGWLWVKNLWMPDSPFATMIADQSSLSQIGVDIWAKVFAGLDATKVAALANLGDGLAITAENINAETIFAALSQSTIYTSEIQRWAVMPELNLIFTKLTIFAQPNGWFLLPILAAATQFLMTMFQPQPAPAGDSQAASTNKMMKYFFPLFSLFICFSYNAGFALYWVASNLIAGVQGYALNKYFDAQEKKSISGAADGGAMK